MRPRILTVRTRGRIIFRKRLIFTAQQFFERIEQLVIYDIAVEFKNKVQLRMNGNTL